jgi:hypothetical protein
VWSPSQKHENPLPGLTRKPAGPPSKKLVLRHDDPGAESYFVMRIHRGKFSVNAHAHEHRDQANRDRGPDMVCECKDRVSAEPLVKVLHEIADLID